MEDNLADGHERTSCRYEEKVRSSMLGHVEMLFNIEELGHRRMNGGETRISLTQTHNFTHEFSQGTRPMAAVS